MKIEFIGQDKSYRVMSGSSFRGMLGRSTHSNRTTRHFIYLGFQDKEYGSTRVAIWHYGSPSLRVVERAEVLPEFLETSDVVKNYVK